MFTQKILTFLALCRVFLNRKSVTCDVKGGTHHGFEKNRTLSERTSERKGYYTGTGCRGFWSIRSDGFPMGDGGLRYNSDKLKKAL